jgi:DNA-binding response OmpR family regulator
MNNIQTSIWNILFVDDDTEIREQSKAFLDNAKLSNGDAVNLSTADFADALSLLHTRKFDIVVLDLRQGEWEINPPDEAGLTVLKQILSTTFLPIIFFTGLAHLVRSLENIAVRIVTKGPKALENLLQVIDEVVATKLPAVHRALTKHVESIQRDYMWNFVVENWDRLSSTSDQASLAYLLARRLAVSLSGEGMDRFIKDLGDEVQQTVDRVHPMNYYLIPPLDGNARVGDVFNASKEQSEHYILLTPSCDLFQQKAEFVLIARCQLLTEQREYLALGEGISKGKVNRLSGLMTNNRTEQPERYLFLPSAFDLPDLVVDLQQLKTTNPKELASWSKIASLDSPYVESLVARFTRYFARVGTPDLDVSLILQRFGFSK